MESYSNISMVEPMNFILMPSLEQRALIKIVTTLWSQVDVISLIEKYFVSVKLSSNFFSRLEWKCIEDKVIEKVPKLPLPESMRKELLSIIKPVGSELLKVLKYINKTCYTDIYLPSKLCWTSLGTVDIKKTATLLIKDESLDIHTRFATACTFCFDSDVKMLWEKIPEDHIISFHGENPPYLIKYWINFMKQTPYGTHQNAFRAVACDGNKIAVVFFLQKMTAEERKDSVASTALEIAKGFHRHLICNVDVLCFLLSQLYEEERKEVLRSHPYRALISFLDWPWQGFFMKTAKYLCNFLSENGYNRLLEHIVEKEMRGYRDNGYKKLFTFFWQQSHSRYKTTAINMMCRYGFKDLLLKLFKVEDKENIALILNSATLLQKESCFREMVPGSILYFVGNPNLLRFFVGKCLSSKERVIDFRKEFMERYYIWKRENIWMQLLQLLDDIIQNYDNKERMDENEDAKRLCNTEFRKE